MKSAFRFLQAILLFIVLPVVVATPAAAVFLCDMFWALLGRKRTAILAKADNTAASAVIPNWNGRDLLEKYLPSVIEAMSGNSRNEIVVVDNGSTDGSVEFVSEKFPLVRLIALGKNVGFGGGSNAGFQAAKNDIVILLNSDMRVASDFLAPLLEPFADPSVFAVSCQIFFSDPQRQRQETGLTQAWWQDGALRVRHRLDDKVTSVFPCFYPGGGSSAFDRRKFLELGGFDELLAPFYLEDNDLGYAAWKRGWKVLYQPASRVWHEHRGTIGKRFSQSYIASILEKNFLLWIWKNIHDPARLIEHFFFAWGGSAVSLFAGESLERASLRGFLRAIRQLPRALRSRWKARALAELNDTEAFRRPMGGYYRDRFLASEPPPDRLRVLMISPYPIEPPIHGGAVFMSQTARELIHHCDLHLIVLLEKRAQLEQHDSLAAQCASFESLVRPQGDDFDLGSIQPHAVQEYASKDLEWLIHRQIYMHSVDVVQIEYANMGQYACQFNRLLTCVFEHDVYFQSIGRQLRQTPALLKKIKPSFEYLRALRWELKMLRRVDRIQVCTRENAEYLSSFDRSLMPKIDIGMRAGIATANYNFSPGGRDPDTILFLGSFRHSPNMEALMWFTSEVMPNILEEQPGARLIAIGSDPPPRHALPALGGAIEMRGFVDDIHRPLSECAVFVCPILSGSGVRVKLLEAFACGIPSVSTRIGAEGLARVDGEFCRLADDPAAFADAVVDLLRHSDTAMVERARQEVERNWDMPVITAALVESYRRGLLR